MEKVNMSAVEYAARKKHGYWGLMYMTHLALKEPEAYELFIKRKDIEEIFSTLNKLGTSRMKDIMEGLFKWRRINSHTLAKGLQLDFYRAFVNSLKYGVFEEMLELLKYASWMEEAKKRKKAS